NSEPCRRHYSCGHGGTDGARLLVEAERGRDVDEALFILAVSPGSTSVAIRSTRENGEASSGPAVRRGSITSNYGPNWPRGQAMKAILTDATAAKSLGPLDLISY